MTNPNHDPQRSNDPKDTLPPDLSVFLEAIALSFEDFLGEINQAIEEVADNLQRELGQEMELFWQDFVTPLMALEIEWEIRTDLTDLSDHFTDDPDGWLNPKVEATRETHPACVGCANYHGRLYNGTLLVCGMHPYGVEESHCLDWERMPDSR